MSLGVEALVCCCRLLLATQVLTHQGNMLMAPSTVFNELGYGLLDKALQQQSYTVLHSLHAALDEYTSGSFRQEGQGIRKHIEVIPLLLHSVA